MYSRIGGVVGTWVKMDESKSGGPTPGLKALGTAREHWHRMFRKQRGAVVEIMKATTTAKHSAPRLRA